MLDEKNEHFFVGTFRESFDLLRDSASKQAIASRARKTTRISAVNAQKYSRRQKA
jgi:hypothetical protein